MRVQYENAGERINIDDWSNQSAGHRSSGGKGDPELRPPCGNPVKICEKCAPGPMKLLDNQP